MIRVEEHIRSVAQIPAERFPAVLRRLHEIKEAASRFKSLTLALETEFFRKNFGEMPDLDELKHLI